MSLAATINLGSLIVVNEATITRDIPFALQDLTDDQLDRIVQLQSEGFIDDDDLEDDRHWPSEDDLDEELEEEYFEEEYEEDDYDDEDDDDF